MSDKYWEIVEYECQDGKCLMIHNIPNDSKLGALSLDHRSIGEAIVEKLNEQQDTIDKLQELVAELGATLLMNGFEIEINGKDLNELIKDE